METKTTYRELTDVENTLKLRQVLSTLPPFCKDYFRAIRLQQQKPGFLMRMTFGFFFSFYWIKIQPLRIILSGILL